jgi:putative transposase
VKQIYLQSYFRSGYHRFMNYIYNISNHPKKNEIEKRLEIIKFFDEFGEKATERAFLKKRSTIYLWKQKINKGGGKLSALAPGDKAPKNRSKRKVSPDTVKFVLDYRLAHPGSDKTTIKPALDVFCLQNNLPLVCESTIGSIIKELKDQGKLPDYYIRTTINGKTGKLRYKRIGKPKKKRLRIGNYCPKDPGDLIQVDAITLFSLKTKRYIITAIDIKTRFAFAYCYKTLSSQSAKDFIQKLQIVAPFEVKAVQTDNGSEFAKHFDDYLKQSNITHYWNYPNNPKSNCYIENFNGLIQRQYVSYHMDELDDPAEFNQGLISYLLWYNGEKPHRSIGKLPPLLYYVNNFIGSQKSNMLVAGARH